MKTALARHATARLCSKEAEDAATRPDVAHHLTLKVGAVLEDRRIVCSRPAPSTLRSYPYLLARKLSVASSQADAPALCRVLTETCRRCHLEGAPYVILEHVLLVLQETIVPARGALRMLSCLLCHRTLTQQPALLNGQCYVPSDRASEDSCRPQGFAIGALALNSLSLLPPGHARAHLKYRSAEPSSVLRLNSLPCRTPRGLPMRPWKPGDAAEPACRYRPRQLQAGQFSLEPHRIPLRLQCALHSRSKRVRSVRPPAAHAIRTRLRRRSARRPDQKHDLAGPPDLRVHLLG